MKRAALSFPALDPNPSAHQLDQVRADGQTQAGTAVTPRARSIGLDERIKYVGLFLRRNSDTGIGNASV